MAESPIPAYVDTRKVFLQHEKVRGSIQLEKLPRVLKALASQDGWVKVELRFSLNDSKQRIIQGDLDAELQVVCQRCLEPLAITLHDDIRLAVINEESQADRLEPEYDPWICADKKLVLAELVEEQLILCMPIVNFHSDKDCMVDLGYKTPESAQSNPQDDVEKENPFSVLKALKK